MNYYSSWIADTVSALAGIIVGILGILGTLKGAGLGAHAVEYGAMARRLSEVETRADQMGETIYRKDRQLIAATEEAADAKASAERAESRASAAERRAQELEDRCNRLEHALDELLIRTRMPAAERERLRTLFLADGTGPEP